MTLSRAIAIAAEAHAGQVGKRLVRVVAPHFVAGFVTDGRVRLAAPILAYMTGWSDDRARSYIAKKGWTASLCALKQLGAEP